MRHQKADKTNSNENLSIDQSTIYGCELRRFAIKAKYRVAIHIECVTQFR